MQEFTILMESLHHLLNLPPYSPFLNIIENCFSKWKNFVSRTNCNSADELFIEISRGYEMISEEDCAGFYRKMLRNLPAYQNSKDIF